MNEALVKQISLAEAALLTAAAQSQPTPQPTVCLSGFHTGHAAIVWLESLPGAKVIVFDKFEHQHQRGDPCPHLLLTVSISPDTESPILQGVWLSSKASSKIDLYRSWERFPSRYKK